MSCMGHAWKPIEGLPEGWAEWRDSEFLALAEFLENLKRDAPSQAAAALARVSRDWAIETGMVENLYHWDRGVTETMLDDGFRADRIPADASGRRKSEEICLLLEDQREVVDWLFDFVKSDRGFSRSLINEIHAMLVRHQPTYTAYMNVGGQKVAKEKELRPGQLKTDPNSVELEDGSRFEYCPVDHVENELDRLVAMYKEYESSVPPEIIAAWLHHRFVLIHPYPDGNGRVARALASLVLIKGRGFPFIVRTQERKRYFDALGMADFGDLAPVLDLVKMAQRRELARIGYVPRETRQPASLGSVDEILDAIQAKLVDRNELTPTSWMTGVAKANVFRERALKRFIESTNALRKRFSNLEGFNTEATNTNADGWLAGVASLEPWAIRAFEKVNLGAVLKVWLKRRFEIVCVQRGVASPFNGVVASEFIVLDEGHVVHYDPSSAHIACYTEPDADAYQRYDRWLDAQMKLALQRVLELA